jgi:SAM-dependent methyltransferase
MSIRSSGILKRGLKRLVPVGWRLMRYTAYQKLRYYPDLVLSLGRGLNCPFCGWHFRRFLSAGLNHPVLLEKRVIGTGFRRNVLCPRCKSNPRERLMYLYLRNRTILLSESLTVLHVAPEPQLQRALLRCPRLRYLSTDYADVPNCSIRVRTDLQRLAYHNDVFDVVICSHVLEHVADDRAAMREILRVLKPGGWSILQVPIALALEKTYEDPTVVDENERVRHFGQRDHVRLYAADYADRLRDSGFSVEMFSGFKEFGEAACNKHGLNAHEDLYICSKPA